MLCKCNNYCMLRLLFILIFPAYIEQTSYLFRFYIAIAVQFDERVRPLLSYDL